MYYLFVIGRFLTSLFPRCVGYFVAWLCGWVHYLASSRDRAAVAYNLAPFARNSRELHRRVRRTFVNFGYYLVDFFRYEYLDARFIERFVTVRGREHLDAAVARGKGVILLTAHLGNYELGGAVIAQLGYKTHAVALPHKDARLNRFFNERRAMTGLHTISTGVGVRQCFQVLKKGEVIAFLGDRDFAGGGIPHKVGARRALLPRGTAVFAVKTGAAIVPTLFMRDGAKRYELIFEKAFDTAGCDEDSILKLQAELLVRGITQYPGQWYMFQKYWIDEAAAVPINASRNGCIA